ncbi:hypothetical protein E2C01_061149 [Portunus trituberculatus]|uniref:Uncharacterized protein n=1 Tax=Portunus trituberculatus TaxID=210409 RepID=A0A5B7HAW9_PORTR|nr:hypothetical protein [Portunus trituberculatus]
MDAASHILHVSRDLCVAYPWDFEHDFHTPFPLHLLTHPHQRTFLFLAWLGGGIGNQHTSSPSLGDPGSYQPLYHQVVLVGGELIRPSPSIYLLKRQQKLASDTEGICSFLSSLPTAIVAGTGPFTCVQWPT